LHVRMRPGGVRMRLVLVTVFRCVRTLRTVCGRGREHSHCKRRDERFV
jgi:hypothetical protein